MKSMKFIKLFWRFIPQFKWRILAYILLNILCSICSAFSFIALIPLVKIIFGVSDETLSYIGFDNITSFSSFLDVAKNDLLCYFQTQISVSGHIDVLVELGLFIITMSFLSNFFSYFAYWVRIPIGTGISRDLRQEAYSKILNMPILSFSKENRGDFISRMTNDVEEVESGIGSILDMLIKDPVQIIVYVFVLLNISQILTLYALSFLLICCAFVFIIGKRMKTISLLAQSQRGQILSVFEQTIGAIQIIKSFNVEKEMNKKFSLLNNSTRDTFNRQNRFYSLAWPCTDFFSITIIASLLCVGGSLILNGQSNIRGAEFITFLCLFYSIIPPTRDVMKCTFGIRKAIASLERLLKITQSKSEESVSIRKDVPQKEFSLDEPLIEFNDVFFSYESATVLKNISLKVKKCENITIVGQTGSGKSTMIKLLLGFFDTTKGYILFQGINIKNFNKTELRKEISYVSQNPILFNDTIYNNIALGKPNATKEEVINAAKLAHIHDFIMSTPKQYNTIVGDNGTNLSGGQRQCITIARAILKSAQILILDEATTSLDPELENTILESLNKFMKGKTIISITHRIRPIHNSNQICILNDGNLIVSHSKIGLQKKV
jgi:ABC-type multidrug transport system fused ATPase/permease subunit